MARSSLPRAVQSEREAERLKCGRRKTVSYRRLMMEFLEQRLLMAQDVWTGGGDGKTWQDGHNWSLGAAPGSGDAASINVGSSLTITYNGNSTIESVTDNAAIDIAGGSLSLTSGASSVSGAFSVAAGASLSASGAGTTFTATGLATIDGANLSASSGASLAFPGATSDSGSNGATIQASGTNSLVDLSHLTSISGASGYSTLNINASGGGEVNLKNVTSQPTGRIYASAQGTSSVIDLSKLPELQSDSQYDSGLEAGAGGSILTGALTTLNRGDLQLDDNKSSITTSQISSITSSNLYVDGGGDMAFPALTQFSQPNGAIIQASGSGSVLDLSKLTSLVGATGYSTLSLNAQAGGKVDLIGVTGQPSGRIYANAQGTNSVIDLSKLPELQSDSQYDSGLEAGAGGSILTGALTTLNRGDLQLDDNKSSITTSKIASITSSNLYVYGGGDMTFPALTQFSQPNGATIQASGAGSVLDLSKLTSLVGATGYSSLNINAQAGGKVNLSGVTGQPSGRIYANAQGINSVIDLSKLPELQSDSQYDSGFEAGAGGSILTGALTTLNRGDLQLDDNSSSITTSKITSITSSNLYVYGGGDMAFPALTQFSQPNGATIQASGAGSVLDLSKLTSLVGATAYSSLNINAQAGGKVNLSGVTSQPSGRIYANAQGTNSVIDLSKLPELQSDSQYDSGLEAGAGGSILTGALTTLNRGDLQVDDNKSSIATSQISSITSSNLYVYGGGDMAFPALTQFSQPNGATIQASGAGSMLDLTSLTSLSGATGYSSVNLNALSGGEVNLKNVTDQPSGRIYANAQGTNSIIDFSRLPQLFSDAQYDSEFEAGTGGSIKSGALTTLNRGDLQLDDGSSSIITGQIASITASNLYVYGGGDLAFPALTQFSAPNGATIQASGAGSMLDLTSLTSLVGATGYSSLNFTALSGGEVNLKNVTSQPSGRIYAHAQGTNSVIDFSKLPELFSDAQYDSEFEAGTGGSIKSGALTTLNRGDLQLDDNSSSITTSQISSITSSNLFVYGGGDLSFPALVTYSNANGATAQASGGGSALDLSHLATLSGGTGYSIGNVKALVGGTVDLGNLTSDTSGNTSFTSDGANSVIDLTSLTSFSSDANYNATLVASNSGSISLSSGTIVLTRVDVSATSSGTISGGTMWLLPGSSLSGDGTIQANVTSAAATNPGVLRAGVLTIGGNFTQYGAGILTVEVGAPTAGNPYNQLAVTGNAAFDGTLSIALASGFTPQVGNSFPIITYASHSGEFSTYDGLSYATGHTFQTLYSASNLSLVGAVADVRVFPTTGLLTSKAGDATSFSVVLAVKPAANVTLNLHSSNTSEGVVSPASLTFTSANWNVPQTVTVTGVNDNQPGSVAYQVVFSPATSSDPAYSGLTPTSVSLTNLPDEVQNIAVTNLAVTPSTGLNEGSSFTVTWNDSNTGNLPATADWEDQVVITNTTTGDTLATALVPIDPAVDGNLIPGATLAEQYGFTLPTSADGLGNIKITVTANINRSAFESGTSLTNGNLRSDGNGGDYPSAPTTLSVGGVDFALIPSGTTASSLGILQTSSSQSSFDIPVNIAGGTVLYTLINSVYGTAGDTVGTVEIKGTGGADAVFDLIEGTNIRDYNNDGYNNTIAPGTPSASFGGGQVRLDMQTFTLPSAFATQRITDIIFTSTGGIPQGEPFLAGATVTTASGPAQLVLLGSGVAPDIANAASTTVVSGNITPGQVSIVLDPGSDSGKKGDDLTDDTTPTFDVTVNEAGVIAVDYKGDGGSTASQTVTAGGSYSFTSPALSDGGYAAKVTFTPSNGAATVAASIGYTIDTKAPTLVRGTSTAQGPLYSRTLTFSKNIDAATISASSIAISGPGITGSIEPASVIGSGTSYVVNFAAPLTQGGAYTLALSASIADLAGNTIGSGVVDQFQLTPDTTLPVVSTVTPSGLTSLNVSSLSVAFNKAINPTTFTSSEVTINGPGGAIAAGSITITEVDAADYTITIPTQTEEGLYSVSIGGPGVRDISGNAMAAAYQTSFTIDHTVLAVVSVSPSGTVNDVVDHIDVTFNKVMNASSLNGSNITLTGPGGAVAVGQGYLLSSDTYRIPIAAQRSNGSYQLTIGAGVQAQEGTLLGSAFQASFTVSLPDLVVSGVQPSTSSTTFGATINVTWTVANRGTSGATGPWVDSVYLSTTTTLGAGAIYLGSFTAESSGRLLRAERITARRPSRCRSIRRYPRAITTLSWSPMRVECSTNRT